MIRSLKLKNPYTSGLTIAALITAAAILIRPYVQIGTPMLSLLVGAVFSNFYFSNEKNLKPGVKLAQSKGLEISIVLLGFSISISNYASYKSLFLAIPFVVLSAIFLTMFIGKAFGLTKNQSTLLAFGNSICGSAAIAAASKIIKADDKDVGTSLSVINIIGTCLLFIIPASLAFLPDSALESSAYVIGASLQSVGHVGALGGSFDEKLAVTALSFKMWRVFLLFPACLLLCKFQNNSQSEVKTKPPLYIWGFLFAVILTNSYHHEVFSNLSQAGKVLLTFAMAAVGLNISFKTLFKQSPKILIVGVISSIAIIAINVVLAYLLI